MPSTVECLKRLTDEGWNIPRGGEQGGELNGSSDSDQSSLVLKGRCSEPMFRSVPQQGGERHSPLPPAPLPIVVTVAVKRPVPSVLDRAIDLA